MFRKIKLYFFATMIIFTIYDKVFASVSGMDLFLHVDELFVGCFLIIVGYKFFTKFRFDKIAIQALGIIVVFIFITLFSKYFSNFLNVVLCAFIHLKWFLVFYVVYEVFKDDYIFLKKLFSLMLIASTFGLIINFIMQKEFNNFFDQDVIVRDNKLRMMGFEMHPNNLGILISLLFIYYNFFNGLPSYPKIIYSTFVFAAISIIFLGSRTPLIVIPVAFAHLLLRKRNKVYSFLIILFLTIISSIALTLWGQSIIDRTTKNVQAVIQNPDKTEYVRGVVIYNGIKLMVQHFPVGSGMATFGTSLSAGSKVYDDLKINAKGTFEKMQGGLYDSNFASIAGEAGAIGLILIFLLIGSYYKFCKKALVNHPERIHYAYLIFLTVVIFFVVDPILINAYPSMIYAFFLTLQLARERYVLTHNKLPRGLFPRLIFKAATT